MSATVLDEEDPTPTVVETKKDRKRKAVEVTPEQALGRYLKKMVPIKMKRVDLMVKLQEQYTDDDLKVMPFFKQVFDSIVTLEKGDDNEVYAIRKPDTPAKKGGRVKEDLTPTEMLVKTKEDGKRRMYEVDREGFDANALIAAHSGIRLFFTVEPATVKVRAEGLKKTTE